LELSSAIDKMPSKERETFWFLNSGKLLHFKNAVIFLYLQNDTGQL